MPRRPRSTPRRIAGALLLAAAVLAAVAPRAGAQGTPAYALQTTPAGLTPTGFMSAPAVADFDGDGDLDVFVGRAAGTVAYFENTAGPAGPPAFTERTAAANPLNAAALVYAAAPAVGDLDRDGDLDVLAGRGDGTFSYFQNTASATTTPVFAPPFINPFGLTDVGSNSGPAVADIDGDGDLDVVCGRTDGTLAYFQNTAGAVVPPAFVERTGVLNPFNGVDVGWSSTPSVADPDGDGDLDVLVGDVLGALTLLANTAGPGLPPIFAAPVANPFGLADVGFSSAPAVVDLDRDGDLDVVAGTSVATAPYFANGAPNPLAVTLTGAAGWRLLTSPIGTVTLAALLGPIWTQGVPGADSPAGASNVLRYDETVTTDTDGDGGHDADDGFVAPAAMSEAVGAGRGLFVYVYADDDQDGTPEGFPKTLTVTGAPRTRPFRWGAGGDAALTFTPTGNALADGWNIFGNPFASWFDWDATVSTALETSVYVYDPTIVSYRVHSRGIGGSLPGGIVGSFQGFFAHATAPAPSLTAAPAPADGGPVYGRGGDAIVRVRLALRPAAEGGPGGIPTAARSEWLLALNVQGASNGHDPADAYALVPPAPNYVMLASEVDADSGPIALAVDARPAPDGPVEASLDVAAVAGGAPAGGALVLEWPAAENLPEDWSARLVDRATGAELALDAAGSYAFALDAGAAPRTAGTDAVDAAAAVAPGAPAVFTPDALTTGRFTIVIETGVATGTVPSAPGALALSAPRPNPTSGGATLELNLPAAADVTAALYDALGRRVSVLADGPQSAGRLLLVVEGGALPAGVYAVRAEVRGAAGRQVLVQRLSVTR